MGISRKSSALLAQIIGLAFCIGLFAPPTYAQQSADLAREVDFNIPSQRLSEALLQFSQQAKLQLIIPEDLGDQPCEGIRGQRRVDEALTQLLSKSGLTFNSINASTITIERPAAPHTPHSPRKTSDLQSGDTTGSTTATALQEIVVTANKRPETTLNVADSVTVQRGADLVARGQSDLTDYADYVPGLAISSLGAPGLTAVSIRGISTLNSTSAVGTYLDETPMGSSTGWANGYLTLLDMLPYDLDRVEILRGPQGTLYGAGAMGGLIKYVLKAPDVNEYTGSVGAEAISIDGAGKLGRAVRGRFNMPVIGDVLGVSLSAADRVTPGYMANYYTAERGTNRDEQYSIRLAALWRPIDSLSIKFNAITQTIDAHDVAVKQFAGASTVPASDGSVILAPTNPLPAGHENFAFLAPYHQRVDYYSGTVDWNLPAFEVISATSWSSQRSIEQFDYTQQLGSILNQLGGTSPGLARIEGDFGLDKFTQELRLVSPTDARLEWQVGVFTTHESSFNTQDIKAYSYAYQAVAPSFPPGLYLVSIPEIFDEYAAFGDATWKFTDAWSVSLGGRYAHNDQNFNIYQAPGPLVSESGQFHVGTHDGVTTWSGSVQYHFDPKSMVYARAASGYRPGGPNTPLAGVPQTVGSDSLINYELGLKSTFLGDRAHVDFDVYHIDWKNIQLTAIAPNGVSYLANGGKSVSRGLELATLFQALRNLSVGFNAAYNDAHLTSLVPDASFLQTEYQLPNAPKETASATLTYDLPLLADWQPKLGAAFRYIGWQWLGLVESASLATTPTVRAGGYGAFDLNASLTHGGFTISAYARNLANRLAITSASQQNLVVVNSATGAAQINTAYLQPRTVGIAFDYSF